MLINICVFFLTLLSAFCLLLVFLPAERFNLAMRSASTIVFYFLCLLSGTAIHRQALEHKVQTGTERVGHGGFLADDYDTIEPVYSVNDTWLFIVLGAPVLAVVLLRFFNRQARLHPFIASGYGFYLITSIFLPAWLNPW